MKGIKVTDYLLRAFVCAFVISFVSPTIEATDITKPLVSEKVCPIEILSATSRDGQPATAVVRRPPGKGPFPAVVFLHGGLVPRSIQQLKDDALNGPTHVRFLVAGYVVVTPTFRSRREDPQTQAALWDCLAIIEKVKEIPGVDLKSVVLVGGSGGGSLALELAGETSLAAIAAGEPATVLFAGMFTAAVTKDRELAQKGMEDPKKFYTEELQKHTRAKIQKIRCPVFIGYGNQHAINKINNEITIPELKAAGKTLEVVLYPGQPHGFYFGRNGTPEAGQKFFDDAHAFFKRYLSTAPKLLQESLVTRVPAIPEREKN